MSLSRTPHPSEDGGWATPGLTSRVADAHNSAQRAVTWDGARQKSAAVSGGYPSFFIRNNGFFSRHMRNISSGLPRFAVTSDEYPYTEKEKPRRDRSKCARLSGAVVRMAKRFRTLSLLLLTCIAGYILFHTTPLHYWYHRAPYLGGGKRIVIMLASNKGGGVMGWKDTVNWAIERNSIRNKKEYADRWGYDLEIINMNEKRRYAHEWRESWEKMDHINATLKKYPSAQWFWWLDLNTFVMEPSISLQSHIFNDLQRNTYRDINQYNPLNISHPLTDSYLDADSLSPVGDGKAESINMIVPQDCGGFNLGSFFIKRGEWMDRLLDVMWDPKVYEQMHMHWDHMEQDAFEVLYANQPWIRAHTAFIEQRKVVSFPPGACNESGHDARIHYDERDRDFLVSMAGCEWGRNCSEEMKEYRGVSLRLNRSSWALFREEVVAPLWSKITGKEIIREPVGLP